jgi:histidinol-phosphatase (PHP family)
MSIGEVERFCHAHIVLDYHLHLWEHGPRPLEATLEQVAAYCAHAAEQGVTEIALTEHLFRFRQADAALRGWWDDDPDPALRGAMRAYWDEELGADLDQYVEVALAAKAEGLPVVLGLEVDHYRGRMDTVARVLAGYPFDVLLGSVHWLGAWGFDNWGVPAFAAEWDNRTVESVWDAYAEALEELAGSGTCDVLAHPDLVKVYGRRPGAAAVDECHHRMAEAAARSGLAAEVSSAGWFKPVAEAYPAPSLLGRFHAAGVPITTASDAHNVGGVAARRGDVRELVTAAGYDSLCAFEGRVARAVAL